MQSLFINGTLGVGKSSAAERLAGRGVAHALIDLDAILREAALDDLMVETDRIAVDAVAQALPAALAC
ncbi:hypothetical protein AXX04_14075 [Pseudomonas aeruginosa]|uniref:hypothetical protein n=1 Tax=Pseudomonas aeruginosa TaxID=287 RepID=UPI000E68083A|nr:hypothetical protein [Pseudomonas aeruginosa]MDA3276274.1 hypothetical protein [Pseudomonas aeruginosa]RIZ51311.1 hypothetical protein AXX04_14075 [Pseudomonas aeruginosa]RPY41129.1 hypothetical protein IPC692_12205 [Pseudomonas aeruginosa]RPY51012.1 hypothetical protein IPC688_09040 [Pseudomonas aeruginosa]WCV93014.1 hypothetical protein KK172_11675 [Pseudomonas aeruginosa]